ncbi:MAG: hypothetical protein GY811_19620 [Myxococcales bacterium]|nr:hypothetical protein [Myxococcales bacterium]
MSTALRFRNHETFHRAALYLAITGPLAALASTVLPGGPPLTIALATMVAAVAAMAAVTGASISKIVAGGLVASIGGATLLASLRWGNGNVGPLLFALIVALPMASGLRGRRLMLSIVAGAGAILVARTAAMHVISSSDLSALPTWGSAALSGLAISAASVFALLPRHIEFTQDAVIKAHNQLSGSVNGEIAELVERGIALWTQAKGELTEDDANRAILEEAVLRLMETARRWSDADTRSSHATAESLVERMEALDERIDKADDEVVIKQYEQASAALAEQMKYLTGIAKNRERVLARMHNYLAAMERLRLAVANLASTTASREVVDLAPIVENLEELGQDIDSCSTALRELES